MSRLRLLPALIVLALAPAGALAHVDVRAGDAGAASVIVSVPNESETSDTVSVAIRLPENVVRVRQPAVQGWRTTQDTVPLDPPVAVDGVVTRERVRTVAWSGGSLGPGQRVDLPLRLWVTDGTPRTGLEFPAVQRYRDGQVVRWIGPSGSASPAGVLRSALPTLAVAAAPNIAVSTAPEAAPAPPTSTAAEDDSSPVGVALIIGAVCVVGIALIVIVVRRIRRRPPT